MTVEPPVLFHIRPKYSSAHLFEVSCTVSDPDPAGQNFSLPAWIPGSYLLRDFARHIVSIEAHADGAPVMLRKLDKNTWRCAPCAGPLRLRYEVYAWDLSVRGAYLDTTRGFFNGTSVFVRMHGKESREHRVEIAPPEGVEYARWRVATSLPRAAAQPYDFGIYRAADYDELIDHPVEMGEFTAVEFSACGVPHELVIAGRHRASTERLCRDLRAVCEYHIRFFGDPAPVERYVFLVMAVGDGYGGLEHRASTALLCSRRDLPVSMEGEPGDDYRAFLGLCSHEYFHTWHVKRIKPEAFVHYDLDRENYTTQLWVFEGITSYYQNLALRRAGLITPEAYLELLGETVTRVWRGGGRLKQSLADSSFDAWIKFYKQDENAPNALVNYYAKGALVALALDLILRRESAGACSLDHVMRALWRRHGLTGAGVSEEGFERLAEEISGLNLRAFFDATVRGTADPALAELLPEFGVDFLLRPAESDGEKGGKPSKKGEQELLARPTLGARLAEDGAEAKLAVVLDGGAAQAAGLSGGDVVIAVDGLRATRANLAQLLAARRCGENVRLHIFRRDELMEFTVCPQAPPIDTCVLRLMAETSAAARSRRAAWLGMEG